VSGRNAITWEEKFNKDIRYIESISFLGDWKIIFHTLKKVFVKEHIEFTTNRSIYESLSGNTADNQEKS